MATPLDLLNQSFFTSGVIGDGQNASGANIQRGFNLLNWMLSQWQRKRWLIWHLIDLSVVSTGATSYTVGPGGDMNISQRPDRIEGGFFRQLNTGGPNPVDYPLSILESRIDYNNIALKNLVSFPYEAFYDPAYPMGFLYPYPVPNASIYEVHISVKEVLSQFATLTQDINLPLEYENAIHWELARRMRTTWRLPGDPEINALAKDGLNTLRQANTQIAALILPSELARQGIYNPYSDQIR